MFNALAIVAAAAAIFALYWWYRRLRQDDQLGDIMSHGDKSSLMSSRAQFVVGGSQIPVALTLDPPRIRYQNADVDASIDIKQIDEVEYGSDLLTGGIAGGAVLRLRSHGVAFEFVLDVAAAERWCHRLPPHRINEPGIVHAT
jgi:hypothetical protein